VSGLNHLYRVFPSSLTGPDLIAERWRHGCGKMTQVNPDTGATERILVVAGGSVHQFTAISTVELLNLDAYEAGTSDGWVAGRSLPKSCEQATMYEDEDGVVLVGGYNGLDGHSLYKLTPTSENWELLTPRIEQYRRHHSSVLVPDELVNCHE